MIRGILSAVFLAGLVISVGVWGVSYFSVYYRGNSFLTTAYGGHFQYLHTDQPWAERTDGENYRMGWQVMGYHGFGTLWWPWFTLDPTYWTVHIPLWMPTVVFVFLFPYVYLPLHRMRKRRRKGLCLKCGYDLTGNVSGVCPECGTEIKRP